MSDPTENELPKNDAPNGAPKGKKPRRRQWLLIVSLGLNLVVAGLVVGAVLRHSDSDRMQPVVARDMGLLPYVGALEPQDRQTLGRDFRKARGGEKVTREMLRTHFAEVISVLETEPFDAARFKELLDQRQSRLAQAQKDGAAALTGAVSALDPAARAAYAQRLKKALTRGPRGEGGNRGKPPNAGNKPPRDGY